MKLRDLDAEFYRYQPEGDAIFLPKVETLAEADGVCFVCPKCQTHSVIAWFVGKVPDSAEPGPGRWSPSGTGIDDLVLTPSINLDVHPNEGGCTWHGWVGSNGVPPGEAV